MRGRITVEERTKKIKPDSVAVLSLVSLSVDARRQAWEEGRGVLGRR